MRKKAKKTRSSDKEIKEERESLKNHLTQLDIKWIPKENKKLKKYIKPFILLDREMWMSFGLHQCQFWTR